MVSRSFILNWVSVPGQPASRLGVVTSGKLGGAVVRNRARRLLRDVYRRHQHALRGPLDLVLVARSAIRGLKVQEVEREYLTVLRRQALFEREP